jgi:hypothetical protein
MGGALGERRHREALRLLHLATHVEKYKNAYPKDENNGQQGQDSDPRAEQFIQDGHDLTPRQELRFTATGKTLRSANDIFAASRDVAAKHRMQ